jgi:transposase, IS5 family
MVRLDSTVTAALVHEPSDSSLLWDAIRVMVRLLREAQAWVGGSALAWRDHHRAAKRRARDIQYTRGRPKRVQLYRELINLTRAMLAYLHRATTRLATATDLAASLWQAKVRHYRPLIEQIIAQTERRVLAAAPVPASDKLVSLFEPHADIIRKGREVAYGHKLNLITGRSGLILDVVIEAGNPADSERLLSMLERHIAFYGRAPRQAAADGSFASRDNLRRAKAQGVRDMAFHKRGGLRIEDMVRSRWVYRKLRNFRAGIEADISCLKRAYGLARCTWRGLGHFRAYVWSAVVAYNLALFTRLKPT